MGMNWYLMVFYVTSAAMTFTSAGPIATRAECLRMEAQVRHHYGVHRVIVDKRHHKTTVVAGVDTDCIGGGRR